MTGVTAALSMPGWILVLALPSVVIGIFGYRWIHRVMQATAVVVGVSLIIMFIQGLRHGSLPASQTALARPSAGLFLAGGRPAGNRHAVVRAVRVRLHPLPARQNQRTAAVLVHLLGQRAGHRRLLRDRRLPGRPAALAGSGRGRRQDLGRWALIIMALSLVNANTFNAYAGSFQVIAFGSMWRRFKAESVTVRLIPFLCVMSVGVVIACLGYQQFVTNLSNFLDVLLVLFIPVERREPGRLLPDPARQLRRPLLLHRRRLGPFWSCCR